VADSEWEDQLITDIRAHGGRPSAGPLAGHPLMLMYSTGAKSGERRRSILTYSRDGDDFIVAGTNGGNADRHPAWLTNVEAQPNVTLEIGDQTVEATAQPVDEPERTRLWDNHVAQLPWFGAYPEKITGRTIPVIRIHPKAASA